MGRVDDDYRCPLCGRVGAGGYAPDTIGYPICTKDPYSCLDKVIEGKTSPEIVGTSLRRILRNHILTQDPSLMNLIAVFIR